MIAVLDGDEVDSECLFAGLCPSFLIQDCDILFCFYRRLQFYWASATFTFTPVCIGPLHPPDFVLPPS